MKRTPEQQRSITRWWRLIFWSTICLAVIAAECFVVGGLLNMLDTPDVKAGLVYQFIIPVVAGFAAILIMIAPKLYRDLWDQHAKTEITVIEMESRKFAELYNQFAKERGQDTRLEIIKEGLK